MIGQTISHYKILEKLGEGGMGVVYKAQDTKLDRLVALKFLPSKASYNEDDRGRFLQEAKIVATISHPNVCTIFAIEEFDHPSEGERTTFLSMEYVDGMTLREKVERGSLSVADVVKYAIQIGEALSEAHKKGIVHRDIKAQNIMVNNRDVVKVMDFGLAKLRGSSRRSSTGSTSGTLAYMSPEQARGEAVDAPTDIWSLGVLLYELLVGRLPFFHEYEAAIAYSLLNEPPKPPRDIREDIPEALERIVLRCLCKEWQHRYASALDLVHDLSRLSKSLEDGEPAQATPQRTRTESRKETERKPATIVVLSIHGYAELIAALELEEITFILEKYRTTIRRVADAFEATINRDTEDKVILLFGLPEAIEQATKKALHAAMEIRRELHGLNHELNLQQVLNPVIGIESGLVLAGSIGPDEKKDYTVLGDPMDLAMKLVHVAEKGEIVVGPITHKQSSEEFSYRKGRFVSFRPEGEMLPTFKLVGPRQGVRPGIERMLFSEMVGREHELDKLELHVLKAINGEGSIVTVMGEPGVGKSRLMTELRKKKAMERVLLLEGKAISHGKALSFHPIIEILKRWGHIEEEDQAVNAFRKLEKAIAGLLPDGVDEILPFVGTLMGMRLEGKHAERVKGIGGDALMKMIQRSMRELIVRGSERRPIVFIIEDLHWADQSSIALMQSLFRLAEGKRILFLNVMRPHYAETSDRLLAAIRQRYPTLSTELHLEPLDDQQCKLLIQNLMKQSDIPEQVNKLILSKAAGNPFFIEEVIRTFVDERAVEIKDGRFHATTKIESIVIPGSIQQLLMARIDKLEDGSKSLLKVASVIGRNFFHRVLIEVAKDIPEIEVKLEHLKEAELIRETGRVDELEYLFKHALVQDVVYESIPMKKRQELHQRVALTIETVFIDRVYEFYGMLAMHFSRADSRDKAEEYLLKAGEATLHSAASHEALGYFEEAMKLYLEKYGSLADPDRIAMFEQNIGIALYNKGMLVDAVHHLDRALKLMGERVPKGRLGRLLGGLWDFLWIVKGLYRPSARIKREVTQHDQLLFKLRYNRAYAVANFDPQRFFFDLLRMIRWRIGYDLPAAEACSMYSLGSSLMIFSGISPTLSKRFIDRARALAVRDDPKAFLVFKYSELVYHYHVGQWNIKLDFEEDLVKTNMKLGEFYPTIYYISFFLYIAVGRGDFDETRRLIEVLRELGETYDYDYARLYGMTFEVHYNDNRRNAQEALCYVEQGIEMANKIGLNTWLVSFAGYKAKNQVIMNDLVGAEESLRVGEEKLAKLGRIAGMFTMNLFIAWLHYDVVVLEDLLSRNGRQAKNPRIDEVRKRAHRSAKQVKAQFRTLWEFKPEGYRYTGTLFWLEENHNRALEFWKKSIDAATTMPKRQELGRTYLEVARRLLSNERPVHELAGIDGNDYLNRAREIFQEMNLEWDLREVDRLR